MTVNDRILKYIEYKSLTLIEFERRCAFGSGMARRINERTRPATFDRIAAAFPDLNIDWLRTGQGEMVKEVPAVTAPPQLPLEVALLNEQRIVAKQQDQIDRLLAIIERMQGVID